MALLDLLVVAVMPTLQVLLITILGAFVATDYCGILTSETRKHLNKVVFYIFTPSLIASSIAGTITLREIISWWFMPVNIGVIFFFGSVLGWMVVKILRPEAHLGGLLVASCSAGNLGMTIIIIPAICNQDTHLFGDSGICQNNALAYASFTMALGGFYIWTYTYNLMKEYSMLYKKMTSIEEGSSNPNVRNTDCTADESSHLLKHEMEDSQISVAKYSSGDQSEEGGRWRKIKVVVHQAAKELLAPPTCSVFVGLVVGVVPWLKSLIIGPSAPLHVVEDSLKLLGGGTIPSVTLILGGNLTKGMTGMGKARLRSSLIVGVLFVKYVVLPIVGIGVVKGAVGLGLLPLDPLFQYTLLIQYTLPPATSIVTMTELFDVGKEECSFILLWTNLVAAFALTGWSTVYLWILSTH